MTAPDPRVGEIEDRLNALESKTAHNAVFGDILRTGWCTYYFGADSKWHNARTGEAIQDLDALEDERLAEDEVSEWLTPHSPSDVAYLLAELRKRDEALTRIEALAEQWTKRGEHDMAFSKTIPDEDIAMVLLTEGASMVENARHIRNALKGDGA